MEYSRNLKSREQRARRHVEKCGDGFKLTKRRNAGYMIVHPATSSVVFSSDSDWGLTLEEVEEFADIRR